MEIDDIPIFERHEFIENCKCGEIHILLSSYNKNPEYEHSVYIPCSCGNYVEFILTVN